MKLAIIKGLNPDQVKEMRANFKASTLVRSRLQTLTKEKTETKRVTAKSMDAFKDPSWPYLQAYALGYEKAMDEIFSLLSDDSVEKD